MLPLAIVKEVRRLLDAGELSHRKIAQQLGISRGTIGAISSGRRGLHGREQVSEDPFVAELYLLPERCRGCGGKVYQPCRLCRTRAIKGRQRLVPSLPECGRHVA